MLLFTTLCALTADVSVQRVTFGGHEDCLRLSNGKVQAVVSPSIGRVVSFGFVGGENLLWVNPDAPKPGEYANHGGDKVWTAPQSQWLWPPEPALDGRPFKFAIKGGDTIEIDGEVSDKLHVAVRRRFHMRPGVASLEVDNMLTYAGTSTAQIGAWEVCQVAAPERITIPFPSSSPKPTYYDYPEMRLKPGMVTVKPHAIEVKWTGESGSKLGCASPLGRIVADFPHARFTISSPYDAKATYPDHGSSLQVFQSAAPTKYVEMELCAPLRTFTKPGAQTMHVVWRLERR